MTRAAATATKKPDREPRKIRDAGRFELAIGSEVELGRGLVTTLLDGKPRSHLVYDRGEFWFYAEATGVFRKIPEHELDQIVQRWDGAATPRGQLSLSAQKVKGTRRCAASQVARPGFFNDEEDSMPGIAFSNGYVTVDKEGVRLDEHSPDHHATVAASYPYAPGKGKLWPRFLDDIFRGDEDADDKKRVLQQFAGACLLGIPTRYQKALVLVGTGSNGKSVFLHVLMALFPRSAISSIPPHEFDEFYSRAMLVNSRINVVSEMPEGDILDSGPFKAIVAGDEITARNPTERPFSFRPTTGHIFAANTLPMTSDQSHGFWRRMLVVTLNREFSAAEQDEGLRRRIVSDELPAVAAWALEGAVDLLCRGRYSDPRSSAEAITKWRRGADQVRLFAEECLTVVEEPTTGGAKLYDAYASWAKRNGHGALNSNKFAARLTTLGLGIKRLQLHGGNFWNVELLP